MAINFTKLQKTATKLIVDNGQILTFSRASISAIDRVLGKVTSTVSTYQISCVVGKYKIHEADGTLIKLGDIKLLTEATGTKPLIGDKVVIDSVTYIVKNVVPTSPSGIVVKYDVQVRK